MNGRRAIVGAVLALALALATPAFASEQHPTLGELENEVYCPTCHTPLSQSSSPAADRIRSFIDRRIAAGDTKSEIKSKLVAQFGEAILAEPPAKGFNLLAWVLPFVGLGLSGAAIGFVIVRWTRSGRARSRPAEVDPALNGHRKLDPELERRLDEELARFDG